MCFDSWNGILGSLNAETRRGVSSNLCDGVIIGMTSASCKFCRSILIIKWLISDEKAKFIERL